MNNARGRVIFKQLKIMKNDQPKAVPQRHLSTPSIPRRSEADQPFCTTFAAKSGKRVCFFV